MADCTLVGNDAMYGLGIRLGLYFQWASTVLSLGWVPSQAEAMRDVNTSFTISTLAALLYISVHLQSSASEIITVLSLCSGGAILTAATRPQNWFSGVALRESRGRFGVLLQNALIAMVTYYQIWFFYRGMDYMGYSSCTQYQFFFAKVSIYGWSRTLNKVIVTLWTIIATIALCLSLYNTFHKGKNARNTKTEDDRGVQVASAMLATKILVFLVLNVELAIRWNNIQGVQTINSTGQMIPLIIGLLGLIKTIYTLIRERVCEKRKVNEDAEMNALNGAKGEPGQ